MQWVEMTAGSVRSHLPSDLLPIYESWISANPEKADRLQGLTEQTISELRDALKSVPVNQVDPRDTYVPLSAVRHLEAIIVHALIMEMGQQMSTAGNSLRTSADVFLRQITFGRWKTTLEDTASPGPRYTVPNNTGSGRVLLPVLFILLILARSASASWLKPGTTVYDTSVNVTHAPVGYTNTTTTLQGHLAGIDNRLRSKADRADMTALAESNALSFVRKSEVPLYEANLIPRTEYHLAPGYNAIIGWSDGVDLIAAGWTNGNGGLTYASADVISVWSTNQYWQEYWLDFAKVWRNASDNAVAGPMGEIFGHTSYAFYKNVGSSVITNHIVASTAYGTIPPNLETAIAHLNYWVYHRLLPSLESLGATSIAAGAADAYDAVNRLLTWNTNAVSGATQPADPIVDPVFILPNNPTPYGWWTDVALKGSTNNFDSWLFFARSSDPTRATDTHQVWASTPDIYYTSSSATPDKSWQRASTNTSILTAIGGDTNAYIGGWVVVVRGYGKTRSWWERVTWSFFREAGNVARETDPAGRNVWMPILPAQYLATNVVYEN